DCEDEGDNGGNARGVIFDGQSDNLHWVWDTGMLRHVTRNPHTLAARLERRITEQDRATWVDGGTPKYIVDYIVKNTVGKIIEGKSPKQIEKVRVLDPACGSGSFLIGAFQYLIDYH